MTPLTHAAVGTAICQKLHRVHWGWVIAFPLAVLSHYLLDAIPHFEKTGPLGDAKENLVITLGLGLVGTALALLLMRWKSDAGRVWLVLFLWVGLGTYSFSLWRIFTAALGMAYVGWKNKHWSAMGYVLAGILAVAPDVMPANFTLMAELHDHAHYHTDWATRIFDAFSHQPFPETRREKLHNPYILLGYALELLVECLIFLGAVILFFRENVAEENTNRKEGKMEEALEITGKS